MKKKKPSAVRIEPDYMTLFKKNPKVIYFDVKEWHAFPFSIDTNKISKDIGVCKAL